MKLEVAYVRGFPRGLVERSAAVSTSEEAGSAEPATCGRSIYYPRRNPDPPPRQRRLDRCRSDSRSTDGLDRADSRPQGTERDRLHQRAPADRSRGL